MLYFTQSGGYTENLIKETADQENRYNNLTEKQKEIKEHLEGIR